jgi:predicted dehydrogenase
VTAVGGRYRFNDDQQTPDTLTATWECNGKMLQWEGLSWSRSLAPMRGVGIELRGSKGSMLIDDAGCSTFDPAGKLVGKTGGSRGDAEHLQNFLDAIHGNAQVNTSIEDGHKSALMCHLANVSYRTRRPVDVDDKTGRIRDSATASKYWQRAYRSGWLSGGAS